MLTDAQCRNATCPPDKARARLTDTAGLLSGNQSGRVKAMVLEDLRERQRKPLGPGQLPGRVVDGGA